MLVGLRGTSSLQIRLSGQMAMVTAMVTTHLETIRMSSLKIVLNGQIVMEMAMVITAEVTTAMLSLMIQPSGVILMEMDTVTIRAGIIQTFSRTMGLNGRMQTVTAMETTLTETMPMRSLQILHSGPISMVTAMVITRQVLPLMIAPILPQMLVQWIPMDATSLNLIPMKTA